MDKQGQRLALFAALLALLLTVVINPYVCRFRNRHEPSEEAVNEFVSGGYVEFQTKCITCKCDLELHKDPEDPEIYWVAEI